MKAVLRIRKEPIYRRAAFESGLKRVGFVLDDRMSKPDGPESWLVIWNRQGIDEAQADAWEAAGGTVIVCENGYLQKVDKTHYAISVHGHNGSGWFPIGDEDRFGTLGFELKPWRHLNTTRYHRALVCAQRGIGSKLMKSPSQWGEKIAMHIDSKSGGIWVATLRQHPGNFKPKTPLTVDLARANACIVWSSAAGVQALVEGVPVFYAAPRWVCSEAVNPFTAFPMIVTVNSLRERALHRMSHGQWHHEEITIGEPFARIISERPKASW